MAGRQGDDYSRQRESEEEFQEIRDPNPRGLCNGRND